MCGLIHLKIFSAPSVSNFLCLHVHFMLRDFVSPLNLLIWQVLEHASVCLTRIAEGFASSPEKLDELCNHGLVTQAATVISPSHSGGGQASLSTPTYTVREDIFFLSASCLLVITRKILQGLIRLLSTCASGSPLGAKTLLLHGISGILKDILAGYGLSSSISVSPALTRPPEQVFDGFAIVFSENTFLFLAAVFCQLFSKQDTDVLVMLELLFNFCRHIINDFGYHTFEAMTLDREKSTLQ